MPVDNHQRSPRRDAAVAPTAFPLMLAAKCPEKFAGKYRQTYPEPCARLRRRAYRHLNSHLCLNLNLDLDLNLNLFLFPNSFQQSFQQLFATLFDSMLD